ncbi:MAG TPA: beta/gamma crystallin-related protein [Ramlibacter sp.]|nr:beta/gamma crystallin-related protein [Ramlibacter sp.]
MKKIAPILFATAALAFAAQAAAQVTFYEHDGFQGRTFTTQQRVGNLERSGFSDRASSVVVVGQRWQACEDVRFDGRCTVLRPGQYPSLQAMGLNDRISSVRPLAADERVAEADYAPMPVVSQDFRRRRNERLYDAEVTSSRAVVGTPGQRCWMEREQVQQQQQQPQQANLNLPGAAIGAVIGGVLGHQVGGGSGKQIATVAGAVGGAALGSQYGRDAAPTMVTQDVRRCDSNPVQATPAYWDVTYEFRGQQHRAQLASAPGRTIVVNRNGEPRV